MLARLYCLSDELSDNSHDQHWTHADMRGQNLQASRLTTKVNQPQRIVHTEGVTGSIPISPTQVSGHFHR